MTKERDWTKTKYYPVSIEKLTKASMGEAAYLIAPLDIGEDYEYFDKVKHLLDIPEKPKTLDEISQELDEKIDKLIENTKSKFYQSKCISEKLYNAKFDRIIQDFEYAVKYGNFPFKLILNNATTGTDLSVGSYETSYEIKQGNNHKGYYTIGNQRYFRYYINEKPNRFVRFFMKICLGFLWFDEKDE
jgi:hypothetical protein